MSARDEHDAATFEGILFAKSASFALAPQGLQLLLIHA